MTLVLKDTHYPEPRGWETLCVAYEPLNFQVVLRGFLITQLWTQVSPSLTKQQERNSFQSAFDHFLPPPTAPWKGAFCHMGEAILN